jgi:hypothetical protein
MKTIKLITHYFGEIPAWLPFFLKTCTWNPSVEWLFVSDRDKPTGLPQNVKWEKIPFVVFVETCSAMTGYKFNPSTAYRVGDWRPAFGEIFQAFLHGIDFWGHCDIDVFFGNIRKFIDNEMLELNDIISADSRMLCGAFTLYRNCKEINTLYRRGDFAGVVQEKYPPGYDEAGFTNVVKNYFGIRICMKSMHLYRGDIECSKNGVFDKSYNETMMYHFRTQKNGMTITAKEDRDSFFFDDRGIW